MKAMWAEVYRKHDPLILMVPYRSTLSGSRNENPDFTSDISLLMKVEPVIHSSGCFLANVMDMR